ncbi:TPA: helix-turn-helix transcriptional regulator [Serratia marcescens]
MKKTIINKSLNIQIIDDDKFYTSGLAIALSDYLGSINITAHIYPLPFKEITADIIFQGIRCGTLVARENLARRSDSEKFYFVIVDRKDTHLKHLYKGVEKSSILYRHQSIGCVLQLIGNSLFPPPNTSEKTLKTSQFSLYESLTPREQEVLYHLKQGKTHTGVATCLGIKVKTISSHKRAAMRKLNFKRTSELLHWMIQGGLTCHQPRKGN